MKKMHQPLPTQTKTRTLPERLVNIQALRAIAVMLVVLVHLQVNETRITNAPILSPWLYHGVSGVDLFFVISGFIMVYISYQKFGSVRHAGLFMLDRAARIYPPAMLFTGLVVLGIILAGTGDKWFPNNNILYSFLLFPQKSEPLLGVSWTLIHELYFYLVFTVLLLSTFRLLPLWLVLWAALIWWGQKTGLWNINPWTRIAFHPLTFEFIAGAIAGLCAVHFKPRWGLGFIGVGMLLFILGVLNLGLLSPGDYPKGWGRVIAFTPGAACMVYGAFALEAKGQWRAPAGLVMLGNWSYSLYLSHLLIISALVHVWLAFAWTGLMAQLLFLAASIMGIISFAALAYNGFERPVLRFTKAKIRRIFRT